MSFHVSPDDQLRVGFFLEGMAGPGSGTWSRFRTLSLGLRNRGIEVHAMTPESYFPQVDELGLTSNTLLRPQPKIARFFSRKRKLEEFAQTMRLDVIHIEAPPFLGISKAKTLGSIHDLRHFQTSPFRYRSLEEVYQRFFLPSQARSLSGIATLSRWGSADVARRLHVGDERIFEIPPLVVRPFQDSFPSNLIPSERRFALVLGHLEARKNIETVILATMDTAWPSGLDLVIAGRDNGSEVALRRLASKSPMVVHFTGPISEFEKWDLLSHAEMVLCPSILEGFGIVAVEAPLAGSPVLVSDSTALPELAGTTDAIVETLSSPAWAEAASKMFSNTNFRAHVLNAQIAHSKRFREQDVINKLMQAYRALSSKSLSGQ